MNKQKKIVSMFDEIAKTYDISNRVLSFGIDKSWRRDACERTFQILNKQEIESIIDVACGTGDMCEYWDKIAKQKNLYIKEIIGSDPSSGMLEVAKKKSLNATYVIAEAKDLPFKDNKADILSISYGLRNVVDRKEALKEFYRVLKEGGLLVILEFTKLKNENFISKFRDFYMKKILPIVGGVLSKNFSAYKYLPNSIDNFLTKEGLIDELEKIGFQIETTKGYSMDISTLIIARKKFK